MLRQPGLRTGSRRRASSPHNSATTLANQLRALLTALDGEAPVLAGTLDHTVEQGRRWWIDSRPGSLR